MLFTGALAGDIADAVAYTANFTLLDGSLDDLGEYIISGLVQSAGTGFSVNVTSGVASIGGRVTKASGFVIGSLTPSNTNHLYLNQDGTGTSNTTGTQPALSVKLGTATTDGAGVTAVATNFASGRMTRRRTEALVHGSGAGHPRAVDLAQWHATNNEGNEVKGTLPSTALAANIFLKDSNPQTLSDGVNIAVGSTSGTKLGTATTQKLGFFNAAPIVQPANTTDLRVALINLGFVATGGATPLDLNGGTFACSTISDTLTDSGTSIESDMMNLTHHSSGTPAAGFGTAITFGGDDNANVNRKMGRLTATWLDASTALSISQVTLKAAKGAAYVTALIADGNQLVTVPGALAVGNAATLTVTDTGTAALTTNLTVTHALSSGTAALGHGTAILMQAMNSSNAQFTAGKINAFTTVVTPGNEGSALSLKIFYTGQLCEVARCRAVGMAVAAGAGGEFTIFGDLGHQGTNVGFYNTTPIARPAAYTLAGSATRTFPTDPSSAYTGIATGVGGTPYAQLTDLNTLRTVVSSLEGVIRQIVQDLGKTNGVGLNNT